MESIEQDICKEYLKLRKTVIGDTSDSEDSLLSSIRTANANPSAKIHRIHLFSFDRELEYENKPKRKTINTPILKKKTVFLHEQRSLPDLSFFRRNKKEKDQFSTKFIKIVCQVVACCGF